MKKFIGITLTALLVTVFAVGCGSSETSSSKNDNAAGQTAEEAGEEAAKDTAEETAQGAEWPRTYVDALGNEVVLEKQPERAVSLMHVMYPDYMYALGIEPIGSAAADNFVNQYSIFKKYTDKQKVANVGEVTAPNLEAILALEPDVIFAYPGQEEMYDELNKIAPTIVMDNTKVNLDWKYGLEEFAKILGKEDKVQAVIAETEAAMAEGTAQLEEFRSKGESVLFLAITEKNIWPYTVEQLQSVYNEESGLGLKAPEGYEELTDSSTALSLEAIMEYNPDHIFLMTNYGDDVAEAYVEELNSNSVWTAISAVQNGNVYLTDRSIFAFNAPIATQYGVGFVVEKLAKK